MADKPVVITKLEVSNFKRLKAVRIVPGDGAVVFVRGDNGQGKSSVLDSIAAAFGGPKVTAELAPEVVRTGENGAEVLVELSNGIKVERSWTRGDDGKTRMQIEVRSKEDARFSSPQARIDEFIGRLTFDPMTFMRLEPKKQAEAVRELAKLDFTKADANRERLYQERTRVNAEVGSLEARLSKMLPFSGLVRVDVAELLKRQDALLADEKLAEQSQRDLDERVRGQTEARQAVHVAKGVVDKLRAELTAAEKRVAEKEAALEAADNAVRLAQRAADAAPIVGPDLDELREKLSSAEAHNARVTADSERSRAEQERRDAIVRSSDLTKGIARVDEVKAEQLAAAKLPVPGLGFTADGVLLNALPLEQASAAERLRVSVAMGLALNPKVKVLLLRDASLLDEKSLAMVAEMAEAASAQVWLEVVQRGDYGIVIEDGEVALVDGKPVQKRCCERDTNGDGNCDVHSASGKKRKLRAVE